MSETEHYDIFADAIRRLDSAFEYADIDQEAVWIARHTARQQKSFPFGRHGSTPRFSLNLLPVPRPARGPRPPACLSFLIRSVC